MGNQSFRTQISKMEKTQATPKMFSQKKGDYIRHLQRAFLSQEEEGKK